MILFLVSFFTGTIFGICLGKIFGKELSKLDFLFIGQGICFFTALLLLLFTIYFVFSNL